MLTDAEALSYNHRIREAEAPFVYESTAVLAEIDLERTEASRGRGQVLDARFARVLPGRWGDTLTLADGTLCAVMEYESMTEFGRAGDAWTTDEAARDLVATMRDNSPFEPISAGLFTEVALF